MRMRPILPLRKYDPLVYRTGLIVTGSVSRYGYRYIVAIAPCGLTVQWSQLLSRTLNWTLRAWKAGDGFYRYMVLREQQP